MSCGPTTITEQGTGTSADPFRVWIGRNWGVRLRARDRRTGRSRNLTGYTGTAQVRRTTADDGVPAATPSVTVVTAATGLYDVEVDGDDLDGLAEGRYVMDAMFTNDLDETDVLFGGFFHLQLIRPVTR